MPLTVRLDRVTFEKLVERSRRENVTLSHLVRRLIFENEDEKRAA
jgi:hypothetical protein